MESWSTLLPPKLSTPDLLAMRLERMILSEELIPGSRLPPEREFAASLGVSRSSLRDALRVLELRALVERKQGSGTRILGVTRSDFGLPLSSGLTDDEKTLRHVMELRATIEPQIAACAAVRATAMEAEQLRQLVHEMSPEMSAVKFAELDRLFHRTIAQYTHNPLFLQLLDRLNEIIDSSRERRLVTKSRRRSSIKEHFSIVDAIASHDADFALNAAKRHIDSVQSRILPRLQSTVERE